jgi:putative addiction module component (TIGR02574 family)
MDVSVEELERKAHALSPSERGEFITRLIASLEGEQEANAQDIAAAWDAEIARRAAQADAGQVDWVPAEQVKQEMRAILDRHRK